MNHLTMAKVLETDCIKERYKLLLKIESTRYSHHLLRDFVSASIDENGKISLLLIKSKEFTSQEKSSINARLVNIIAEITKYNKSVENTNYSINNSLNDEELLKLKEFETRENERILKQFSHSLIPMLKEKEIISNDYELDGPIPYSIMEEKNSMYTETAKLLEQINQKSLKEFQALLKKRDDEIVK